MSTGQIVYRAATLLSGSINRESRTVELSFSSEAPVERSFGIEVLDHSPASVDLGRLRDGAPLLRNHDPKIHVGTILNPRIDGDRVARATAKLSRSAAGEEAFQDVVDGILRKVSVGYVIHQTDAPTRNADGTSTVRVTKWEPLEISLVSIPADNSVGVGRAGFSDNQRKKMEPQLPTNPPAGQLDQNEKDRLEMLSIAQRTNSMDTLVRAINERWSLEQFRAHALNNLPASRPAAPRFADTDDATATSMLKQIRHFVERGSWNDEALRRSESVQREGGMRCRSGGVMFRGEDLFHVTQSRAIQTAGSAPDGGFLVGTQQGPFIDALRKRAVVMSLGATMLNGLQGNLAMPKLKTDAAAEWLAETAAMSGTSVTFGQLSLSPNRVGCYADISRQLLFQTGGVAEMVVRNSMVSAIALAIDLAALNGSGVSGQPLGILNTPNINSTVTYGGAAEWTDVVEHETGIAVDNGDVGSMGWVASAATRGKWKTKLKDAVAGAGYLWPEDGRPNGYPAAVTNQLESSHRTIFGVWAKLIIANWTGLEIVVDPYTLATSNQVRITMQSHLDLGVTNPECFNASTDSAAQ